MSYNRVLADGIGHAHPEVQCGGVVGNPADVQFNIEIFVITPGSQILPCFRDRMGPGFIRADHDMGIFLAQVGITDDLIRCASQVGNDTGEIVFFAGKT